MQPLPLTTYSFYDKHKACPANQSASTTQGISRKNHEPDLKKKKKNQLASIIYTMHQIAAWKTKGN